MTDGDPQKGLPWPATKTDTPSQHIRNTLSASNEIASAMILSSSRIVDSVTIAVKDKDTLGHLSRRLLPRPHTVPRRPGN